MSQRARRVLAILLAALSLVGGYVPEWTDFNEADPGITLGRA